MNASELKDLLTTSAAALRGISQTDFEGILDLIKGIRNNSSLLQPFLALLRWVKPDLTTDALQKELDLAVSGLELLGNQKLLRLADLMERVAQRPLLLRMISRSLDRG